MTKSGLIEKVAELTPHISKKDTEIVVNTIFDSMTEALKDGERIEIRGLRQLPGEGPGGPRGPESEDRVSPCTSPPSGRPSSRSARSSRRWWTPPPRRPPLEEAVSSRRARHGRVKLILKRVIVGGSCSSCVFYGGAIAFSSDENA